MNFASVSQRALETIPATESCESRLLICGKIIRTLKNDLRNEATHRLCAKLRAVLSMIVEDSTATVEQKKAVAGLIVDLRSVDPRRIKQSKKGGKTSDEDLLSSCSRGNTAAVVTESSSDPWDDPTIASVEWFRLNEIQRRYMTFVNGQDTMRQGTDARAMILEILDGRPCTTEVLLKLHRYRRFEEVERILIEQGELALPQPKDFRKQIEERDQHNILGETIA